MVFPDMYQVYSSWRKMLPFCDRKLLILIGAKYLHVPLSLYSLLCCSFVFFNHSSLEMPAVSQ